MNQLFNLIRYIVTKIIFKRGSFTHCILISCAKQLRIFYKNFQTHSGEGIVLCIFFIKYTQNMPYTYVYDIYQRNHIQNTNTVLYYSVPPFLHDILIASIYLYISQRCWVVCSVVLQIYHTLVACASITVHSLHIYIRVYKCTYIYVYSTYIYGSTLTIHEKMRMWDDV